MYGFGEAAQTDDSEAVLTNKMDLRLHMKPLKKMLKMLMETIMQMKIPIPAAWKPTMMVQEHSEFAWVLSLPGPLLELR